MALQSLSDVSNKYGSYRGNSLVGERGAIATVNNPGLDGIVGVPYPNLVDIVIKIGGTYYTYDKYLNALKLSGNPYVNIETLPIISFDLAQLTEEFSETIVYDDVTRTQYAEVVVKDRLSTIDNILNYLNDFFNPDTTNTVLDPVVIGKWDLETSSYSADLDVAGAYPGLQFEENGLDTSTVKISTPPTQQTPKKPEPIPKLEIKTPPPPVVIIPEVIIEEPIILSNNKKLQTSFTMPESPAVNTSTVGTSSTFGVFNYGKGFTNGAAAAEANMQSQQPKKPNFTGRYTGESATGPDGSKWVWIPFQGGWTSSGGPSRF